MSFMFASSNRSLALEFLQKIEPSVNLTDTEDSAKDLLDIIERDEIRVTDPSFHAPQIVQAKNWNETTLDRATAALKKAGISFRNCED